MEGKLSIKVAIGREGQPEQFRVVNRRIRWTPTEIESESDHRYADKLVEELGRRPGQNVMTHSVRESWNARKLAGHQEKHDDVGDGDYPRVGTGQTGGAEGSPALLTIITTPAARSTLVPVPGKPERAEGSPAWASSTREQLTGTLHLVPVPGKPERAKECVEISITRSPTRSAR